MNLNELIAEYVLRGIASEDLKEQAYQLMLAGYENPSLAALAGAEKSLAPADLRDLFERALRETRCATSGSSWRRGFDQAQVRPTRSHR